MGGNGGWQLIRDRAGGGKRVLATGHGKRNLSWQLARARPRPAWHQIIARIDGKVVARVTDRAYRSGPAGIESNWTRVEFRGLTVQ